MADSNNSEYTFNTDYKAKYSSKTGGGQTLYGTYSNVTDPITTTTTADYYKKLQSTKDIYASNGQIYNYVSTNTDAKGDIATIVSGKAQTTTTDTEAQINSVYSGSDGSRLVDFNYNTGSDDASHRAYMQVQGNTGALSEAIANGSSNRSLVSSVYNNIIAKYKAFILVSIQEALQEKQQVLPTVGDTFAATFSGAEPQVVAISGMLPFDNKGDGSWFIYFMNAYNSFIRASKLAKYNCYLKIVLPDFQTYKCYPIALSTSLVADSDYLVRFDMSAIVVNDLAVKAYGISSAASQAVQEVYANNGTVVASATTNTTGETVSTSKGSAASDGKNTSAEVGAAKQKTSGLQTFVSNLQKGVTNVTNTVNTAINSKTGRVVSGIFAAVNTAKKARGQGLF